MTPSTSYRSTFILLFYLLFPCIHGSCPTNCANGYNKPHCECASNCYRKTRQGIPTCERCTIICSEGKNQVEVTPCTQEHNRVCHCKPGFYCKKDNNYGTHCHKPCVPCKTGTFSSKPSLDSACKPHKDCAQLGMIMLTEGRATQDRECGYATTNRPAPAITTISSTTTLTPRTVKKIVTREIPASSSIISISSNTTLTPRTVKKIVTREIPASSSIISISSNTTPTPRTVKKIVTREIAASSSITTISSNTTPTPRTAEDAPQHSDSKSEDSQSHWLLLFILLLMLLFMAGFCMLMKGKVWKTRAKCFGLIKGKHEEQQHWRQISGDHQILSNAQSNTSTNHNMETEIPLGSDVRGVNGQSMGMAPQSGGVQQVTVEHNGKGENVNNTVGSIYIYSPGMVILGSNSGDKKEEAGVCEEARPLIGSPQQESTPPSQEVRVRMSAQEEVEKELSLSFPVPATGK